VTTTPGDRGRFPFDEKFQFAFPKIPVANETSFSGVSGKEDNLARNTQIFRKFLPGISVPFGFPLEIS